MPAVISHTDLQALLGGAGAVLLSYCLARTAPLLKELLAPRRLIDAAVPLVPDPNWPAVSVIVAARNEEPAIRPALTSLAELDYPHLEIIAVDDRSTDGTGRLMEEIAAASGRVRVLHLAQLPHGWLGKNHALWRGANVAHGDWLLFTDGDVRFEPDAVKRAVYYATATGLDHLAVMPELEPGGIWEGLMSSCFGLGFALRYRPWRARTSDPRYFVGVGAFNLVRREAYERIGTHERLALAVADDLELGRLIKQNGLTQDFIGGDRLIRVRWHRGLHGIVKGLTKNAFAGFDYRLGKVIGASVLASAVWFGPYPAAVFLTGWARWPYIGLILFMHAALAAYLRRCRLPLVTALLLPVGMAALLYAIWRSTWLTLRDGGVTWRDTFYPLAELRRAQGR